MNFAKRVPAAVWLAAPAMLFTLVFYWRGLTVWFQSDDFAWMSQWLEVHNARELMKALFEPRAQGSIRPISERAYFLGLQALFGWNALPFRLVVFATQMVGLALLASLTLRVTASRLAAALAPLFWASSTAIAVPMMWSSVYNQILCAAIFFGALRAWISYCDEAGPSRRWLWIQYAIFLTGFGVLETVAVYPLIALSWAPGWKRWRGLVPMFAFSAIYTLFHQWVSPSAKTGFYAFHIDASMISTFAEYLKELFGGPLLSALPVSERLQLLGRATPVLLGLPLVWFALRRRDWRLLVPLALVLAPLLPMLPLRDHITHYYLVTPAVGLAMVIAWCCSEWSRGNWVARVVAAAIAVIFLTTSLVVAQRNRDFWFYRGDGVRTLMLGLVEARRLHPDKELVVAGLDGGRFYASLSENAARSLDLGRIYLAPGSHENIDPVPGEPNPTEFELPWPALNRGLADGTSIVYAAAGGRLRNVTAIYRAIKQAAGEAAPADRVEPASPLYAAQLGQGWLAEGGGARWMGVRALLTLSGVSGAKWVIVEGYCPAVQFAAGPFRISMDINHVNLGQQVVSPPEGRFHLEFRVPREIVPTAKWQVTLATDHIVPLPDGSRASVVISTVFLK